MHKYPLMQRNIQKHLDYISIIYNYSGIKIESSLHLASCRSTAVLQRRLGEHSNNYCGPCFNNQWWLQSASSRIWGWGAALHICQSLRCLNVICVGCKFAVLQRCGSRLGGLGEGACSSVSHRCALWSPQSWEASKKTALALSVYVRQKSDLLMFVVPAYFVLKCWTSVLCQQMLHFAFNFFDAGRMITLSLQTG